MAQVGQTVLMYLLDVTYGDRGAPRTGLTASAFTILLLRNGVSCADPVTLVEIGGGVYSASYTPSSAGTDFLSVRDNTTSVPTSVTTTVTASGGSVLSETFAAGLQPAASLNPNLYTLYVFVASDWGSGLRTPGYAKGRTAMSSSGVWSSPFFVPSGTYTAVLLSSTATLVLVPSFQV